MLNDGSKTTHSVGRIRELPNTVPSCLFLLFYFPLMCTCCQPHTNIFQTPSMGWNYWEQKSEWISQCGGRYFGIFVCICVRSCEVMCECTTAESSLLPRGCCCSPCEEMEDIWRSCQLKHWTAGNRRSLLVLFVWEWKERRRRGKDCTTRGKGVGNILVLYLLKVWVISFDQWCHF